MPTPRRSAVCFFVLVAVLGPGSSPGASGQAGTLLDPALRDLLHEELSGELAKEHVIAITRHHRVQASRGYRAAALDVLTRLRERGFDVSSSWIENFSSNGITQYQTWTSPSGWDIATAELRMVAPTGERLVAYPEIAMSLMTYSNPGRARGGLVWVGRGDSAADYAGKVVAGKFVLATGYGGDVHRLAVLEHGAAGVVCYLDDARAAEHPDMLAYTGLWPKAHELERVRFGFNLSHRQGDRLRGLLERGQEVVLEAEVRGTGLEPYQMDVVVATIQGSERPGEEILFCAHLDHPKESANDNASGAAALIDVARTLRTLIETRRLPRPKRTLRFLWVPEFYGTMAYVDAHPELAGPVLGNKVLAALNLDMVGEHTEILHCRLEVTRTTGSVPSILGDVLADMAAMVDGMDVRTPRGSQAAFNYRVTPFAPGSDHMVFLDRKIPASMLWHSPDWSHHTSEDTPDKVDPVELERCEILSTGAAWYLANLTTAQALDLLALGQAECGRRLGQALQRSLRRLAERVAGKLPDPLREARLVLEHALAREAAVLADILHFQDAPAVAEEVGRAVAALEGLGGDYLLRLDEAARAAGLEVLPSTNRALRFQPPPDAVAGGAAAREGGRGPLPQRLTRGPLAFGFPESVLPEERAAWYRGPDFPFDGITRFELVNLIDGHRDVADIRDALSAQLEVVALEDVQRSIDDLVAAGVVEWWE